MSKLGIFTIEEDVHVDVVIERLQDIGGPEVVRINTDKFPVKNYATAYIDCKHSETVFNILDSNREFALDDIYLGWYRKFRLQSDIDDVYMDAFAKAQTKAFYNYVFSGVENWFNSPIAMNSRCNKLSDLLLARQCGLAVPSTIVSNDPSKLLEKSMGKKFVIKSLDSPIAKSGKEEGYVLSTKILSSSELEQYSDDLRHCPILIQELINSSYELRVTIVSDEVFTCKQSVSPYSDENVDIRLKSFEKQVKYEPYKLPERVKNSLLLFKKRLEMDYLAVDIIRSDNGDYYFLDSNPSGQWLWIELETGLDITGAIARSLKAKWQESSANKRLHADQLKAGSASLHPL